MSKRDDVLKVLSGQTPKYLPWFGDLAYYIDYLTDENLMPKQYKREEYSNSEAAITQGLANPFVGKDLHKFHKDLGVGFYLQGYFPFFTHYDLEVTTDYEGNSKKTVYKTPYGDLTEVWEYITSTHSWGPKEHLLKDATDLKKLRFVYENLTYTPDYKLASDRVNMRDDNGIVVVYTPKTPFMELVALKAGIENVTYMFLDDEAELKATLALMEEKHDIATKIAIDSPGECIFVPDNLSSEVVGGMFYNNYIKPVHTKWVEEIKKSGKYSFVHLDGTLTPLLTELSKVGFNVIEAVTPMPVGDIAVKDLRNYVLEDTIIWGGIPGGFFTNELSDKEFDDFVTDVIKTMKNSKNFVLGVADQVVPNSLEYRIKRVDALVQKYGEIEVHN